MANTLLLDEADAISLDRATLCIVPLMYLSLHNALQHGTSRNILLAGCLLGVSVHFQLYYALYFTLLIPMMLVSRRLRIKHLQNLIRLTPLALILALPALWVLQQGAQGSYTLDSVGIAPLQNIPDEYAQQFLSHKNTDLPTNTPTNRVLSAAKSSLDPKEIYQNIYFWLIPIFGCLIWRTRHRFIGLEILWIVILSMGPVYLFYGWTDIALPYYWIMKYFPGFDQLKNVYRFGLIWVLLAPLPLFLWLKNKGASLVALQLFLS